jgi:hypothetical protein
LSPQLLIRPDRQDTKVIEDLLAPGGGPRSLVGRPAIGAVVIDATHAVERPEFADAAANSGIAALIDPLTFGLQVSPSSTSAFAKLPYAGRAIEGDFNLDLVVDELLDFELANGATVVVPPYFHVQALEDEWTTRTIEAMRRTANRCAQQHIQLPAIAVLSGNRRTLSTVPGLAFVERFSRAAIDLGVGAIAVSVSPSGKPTDSYDGLTRVAAILDRVRVSGAAPIAWRQGAYGLTMAALGAEGYETGIGQAEATDIAGHQGRIHNHTPLAEEQEFRRPRRPVYMSRFGRSVPMSAAEVMLHDQRIQGELLCEIPGCCPTTDDTLERQRHHAVRARAHQLAELDSQPPRWRVQRLLRSLESAIGTARRANEILETSEIAYRVPTANLIAQSELLRYRSGPAGELTA